jgi:hypothetical protein
MSSCDVYCDHRTDQVADLHGNLALRKYVNLAVHLCDLQHEYPGHLKVRVNLNRPQNTYWDVKIRLLSHQNIKLINPDNGDQGHDLCLIVQTQPGNANIEQRLIACAENLRGGTITGFIRVLIKTDPVTNDLAVRFKAFNVTVHECDDVTPDNAECIMELTPTLSR